MKTSNAIKMLITLTCFGASAAAVYNVNSDIAPLQRQAETVACLGKPCAALRSLSRTPLAHTFVFQVQQNSSAVRTVECTRAFVLVGEYSCVGKDLP